MSRSLALVSALALGLLLASPADAARFTTRLDQVESLLTAREADTATPKKLRKAFGGALKKLGKDTTTLVDEVKTALKVITVVEKKAPEDAALQTAATAAVDGLVADVNASLAAAKADAAALVPKSPVERITDFLAAVDRTLLRLPGATTQKARLVVLAEAAGILGKAEKTIVKAGGGGGGPAPCGPDPKPAGIRNLAAGESAQGNVTISGQDPFTFVAGSCTAAIQNRFGNPALPKLFQVFLFDCTRESAVSFSIPPVPTPDTDYFSGVPPFLTEAGFQSDWNGFTQVFPGQNAIKVHVDTFDGAAREITGTLTVNGFMTIDFTIKDWTGEP